MLFKLAPALLATGVVFVARAFGDDCVGVLYTPGSRWYAASADGAVVVGTHGFNAATWTCAGGVRLLTTPDLHQPDTWALGVDWGGTMAVGYATIQVGALTSSEAVRWTLPSGVVLMGTFPSADLHGRAENISGDGSKIVGWGLWNRRSEAWQWHGGAVLDPFLADTPASSTARACSHDGSVIVGDLGVSPCAFTSAGPPLLLSPTPRSGVALACSSDASVVVGHASGSGPVFAPFRWSRDGGFQPLTLLPNMSTGLANGVSADGRIVVGYNQDPRSSARWGFIWDAHNGVQSLRTTVGQVLNIPSPTLGPPLGVSPDGRTIVGDGYIIRLPRPCPGDVDDGTLSGGRDGAVTIDDLLAFLAWYAIGDVRTDLDNGSGNGTPDASVDINDLMYFLSGYEGGC